MIETKLVNEDGRILHTEDYWAEREANLGDQVILVTASPASVHGTFKSVTRTTAGTTIVTSPNANGSLLITDILISGEKQTGSSTIVRFNDGTQNIVVFNASQVDAPPSIAHSFHGRLQGWRDAYIEMETTGAGDATVLICYTKVPEGIPYAEWDALR